MQLYVTEGGRSIGLRVPVAEQGELAPSPLEEVEIDFVRVGGDRFVDIASSQRRTFEPYYALICAITDRLQVQREPLPAALAASLQEWQELLRPVQLLSNEERIGLWGELWALERLLHTGGAELADAWTGPLEGGEPHDLRLGPNEVEVKTSTTGSRQHMFNGLRQLEPSPGHSLFILSLLLEPAGAIAGQSLPERVASIRRLLAQDGARLNGFDQGLASLGYRDHREAHYPERFQLRAPAVVIPVTADFPALTSAAISTLGAEYQRRVREIHYRLDLEGLGHPDGSAPFLEILPADDSR